VKCWLDGKLIHDVNLDAGGVPSLYSVAATDKQSGDLIVKVVNANAAALDTEITLNGASLKGDATAIVLTSENATDENSLAEPMKVSPKTEALKIGGSKFTRSFSGNSFTVLRLKTRK
jgi:alpha-L-arabinofuranosidase